VRKDVYKIIVTIGDESAMNSEGAGVFFRNVFAGWEQNLQDVTFPLTEKPHQAGPMELAYG
jgi:hypothetical protein